MKLYTAAEWSSLSEIGKLEAAQGEPEFELPPLRQSLIDWAREIGVQAAYMFHDLDDYDDGLKENLRKIRDFVPRQDEALAYLKREVRRGFDGCFGWSWCLRDNLRPLFARNASVREIEECAVRNQGSLPDYAVVSVLKALRQDALGAADYQRRQEFYRNRQNVRMQG
jgi:hypothetical protein